MNFEMYTGFVASAFASLRARSEPSFSFQQSLARNVRPPLSSKSVSCPARHSFLFSVDFYEKNQNIRVNASEVLFLRSPQFTGSAAKIVLNRRDRKMGVILFFFFLFIRAQRSFVPVFSTAASSYADTNRA